MPRSLEEALKDGEKPHEWDSRQDINKVLQALGYHELFCCWGEEINQLRSEDIDKCTAHETDEKRKLHRFPEAFLDPLRILRSHILSYDGGEP